MTKYVLGIYFSQDLRSVLMIEKQKPDWQKGRFNFLGGKVEADEGLFDAMVREFAEETGTRTQAADWSMIGVMKGEDWEVTVFSCVALDRHIEPETMEEEQVLWFEVCSPPANSIGNIKWLLSFALDALRMYDTNQSLSFQVLYADDDTEAWRSLHENKRRLNGNNT